MTSSEEDFEFEHATDNAELLAAAQRVVSGTSDEPEPVIDRPQDGPVTLPGGFRKIVTTPSGSSLKEVTKAWVRELNGEDEERIDKARNRGGVADFVNEVLVCGVERLGDDTPTRQDIKNLLTGDQEYLLLEISRATFGNKIEYREVTCQACGEVLDVTINKDEEIPVTRLGSPEEAEFEVPLSNGRVALVNLPTGEVQLLALEEEAGAAANTVMIANCVSEIRGKSGSVTRVDGNLDAARRLGIKDRRTLVEQMSKRMPGPRYNGIKFTHPACGNEIELAVTLSDLFLGM